MDKQEKLLDLQIKELEAQASDRRVKHFLLHGHWPEDPPPPPLDLSWVLYLVAALLIIFVFSI